MTEHILAEIHVELKYISQSIDKLNSDMDARERANGHQDTKIALIEQNCAIKETSFSELKKKHDSLWSRVIFANLIGSGGALSIGTLLYKVLG